MRIVVNPCVHGPVARLARKMRRFVYLAWIARNVGYDVSVHASQSWRALRSKTAYSGRSDFAFLEVLEAFPSVEANALRPSDVYFCAEDALSRAGIRCRVVAWRTQLGGGHKLVAVRRRFDLLVGYVLSQQDFTHKKHISGAPRGDTPCNAGALSNKWLSVPWLPFETTLCQLHRDGMWQAYCQDDLSAIRERYGAEAKQRDVGFIGYPWPWRTRIVANYDGDPRFDVRWANCIEKQMPPTEYLRWLSGCKAFLQLPGDTWKCSRHCEAVMMGVPVVQLRNVMDLAPPLSNDNTILVDDWGDTNAIFAGIEQANDIAANADLAYREGWSLRGQFLQVMKRLEAA